MKKIFSLLLTLLLLASNAYAGVLDFTGWETGNNNEMQASNGTQSVQSSKKRTGAYALRINPTTTGTGYHQLANRNASGGTSNPNVATEYARVYFCVATAPASTSEEMLVMRDTSNAADKLTLRLTSGRLIAVYDSTNTLVATGSTALTVQDCADASDYYRIEVKASNGTSGAYEVKIDGSSELSGTANQAATNVGSVRFGKPTNRNSQSVDFYYDDASINDTDYPGEGAVKVMLADSSGSSSQWNQGTGSTFAEVDEIPTDDDTTYIKNTTSSNQTSCFNLASTSTSGITGTILSVAAFARVREDAASQTSSFSVRVKSTTATSDTTGRNFSDNSWSTSRKVLASDPDTGSAWATAVLDIVQLCAIEANASAQDRVSQLFLMVDYIPSSGSATAVPGLIAGGAI